MFEDATAPSSIGSVLDNGFNLFRASLRATWGIAFIGALAGAPLSQIFAGLGDPTTGLPSPGLAVLGWIVYMIVICIVYSTLLIRIGSVARGEVVPLGSAFRMGLRRSGAFLGASLAYGVAVFFGSLLLIVPGVYLTVALVFASFSVVLENRGPFQALGDSMRLVKGNWWRTTVILTVIACVLIVLYFLVGLIAGFTVAADPEALIERGGFPWFIDYIVMPVLSSVLLPLSYCLLYAAYRDLKLRREGTDLAARLAAAS